jgi:hypothetical protein
MTRTSVPCPAAVLLGLNFSGLKRTHMAAIDLMIPLQLNIEQ